MLIFCDSRLIVLVPRLSEARLAHELGAEQLPLKGLGTLGEATALPSSSRVNDQIEEKKEFKREPRSSKRWNHIACLNLGLVALM